MFNRYLTYYNPAVQILIFFVLFTFGFLFLFGIDKLLIPMLTEGMSATEFAELDLKKFPEYIHIKRIEQLIAQLVVFLVPALVFAYLAFPKPTQYLKIKNAINWRHLALAVGIILAAIPFIELLEYWNKMIPLTKELLELEEAAKNATELILTTTDTKTILFNVFLFVIIPAVSEELLFRGVFQNILISNSKFKNYPFFAILIAAAFFSLMHFQMAGFIPRFYAGFLLGLIYYFSNNIWVPIIVHAINNSFALLMFYLSKTTFDNPIDKLDYKDLLEIVSLTILSVFLIYYFYKKRAQYTIDEVDIDPDEKNLLANYK